jgi:IclR family KDG regulon transcriptional repressor
VSYLVASVDKALELLELMAEQPNLGVTEIADLAGSSKSQVFRLLHTLEQRGFVRKDPTTRTYAIGYRCLYIGERGARQTGLIQVAQPLLNELAEACRENVHLIARDGYRSMVIAMRESPQPLRLYAEVGRRGPLHAGGASIVMLAYAPQEIREHILNDELQVYTAATITDPEKLASVLDRIRQRGFHVSRADLDDGAFSIAAPVRDHRGAVVAALSIAGPMSRLDETREKQYVELVQAFAARISRALAWTENTPAPVV